MFILHNYKWDKEEKISESPELMRALIFESWLGWFGVGWYIFEN